MAVGDYFRSVEKPRLSEDIARQIALAIQEGRFLAGQSLPSERELTQRFQVSRPILREAMRILEQQGYIHIQQGRRTTILDQSVGAEEIPFEDWFSKNAEKILMLFEARLVIEPGCASFAAERRSEHQLLELKSLLVQEDISSIKSNIPLFTGKYIDFHGLVAKLSGNSFLYQAVCSLIVPSIDICRGMLRFPEHLSAAYGGHIRIVEAIEKQDAEAAQDAMIMSLSRPVEFIQKYLKTKEGN